MDYLPNQETLSLWLMQYGSVTLFVLLALGIVMLPVPEETLMVVAGVLMSQDYLNISATLMASYAGSICGITLSYFLGRTVGHYLIQRYGERLGLTDSHLKKVERWFERLGKWALFIGYFVPGVRHFTGFSAGTTGLGFRSFALYAYSGALFWVSTFLSLGYFFGFTWLSLFERVKVDIDQIVVLLILAFACYIGFKLARRNKNSSS